MTPGIGSNREVTKDSHPYCSVKHNWCLINLLCFSRGTFQISGGRPQKSRAQLDFTSVWRSRTINGRAASTASRLFPERCAFSGEEGEGESAGKHGSVSSLCLCSPSTAEWGCDQWWRAHGDLWRGGWWCHR